MDDLRWTVLYGGGLGAEVWDKEATVVAADIYEALDKFEKMMISPDPFDGQMVAPGYTIFSVSQEE